MHHSVLSRSKVPEGHQSMPAGGKGEGGEVLWTVSPIELVVVLALCLVVAYRKENRCMGLVQVLGVGLVPTSNPLR